MNNTVLLLTPIFTFLVVLLVGFVGCGDALPEDGVDLPERKQQDPPPDTKPVDPPPAKPATYEDLVKATPGFLAFWPLNETTGNIANVVGALNPMASGIYATAPGVPAGAGYTLGKDGVLIATDPKDFAPDFEGTGAFIEVPFNGPLNPDPAGTGFSIELWAKPDPMRGADRGTLVSSHLYESPQKQQGYEIGMLKVAGQTHHQIYAHVFSGTGATMTEVVVQPVDGNPDDWRHIVFTYEVTAAATATIRLQVQLAKATGAYAALPVTADYENVTAMKQATLRFASNHPPAGGGLALYAGRLDNIAIYGAPLQDADVKKHFDMA